MCDTVVRVGKGSVLFAKNSDRDPNEAQALTWLPRASHPEGSRVRCTWVDIPQVPRTHAALVSRPYWMWGCEMGANEHGVVIGNEAVFTDQPLEEAGLLGMDLVRLALERSSSARDALETLCQLLETHGQGGGCGHEDRRFSYHNSFLVADPEGAFVLETAGRAWAVERVEKGARSISNGLTIEPFASRHRDRLRTGVACAAARRPRTEALAAQALGPADMMRLLRDHGRGRALPRYSPLNGCMDAPCMHAGGLVASSQTTASWVAELLPSGTTHWATGTAAPCTSLFKPVAVLDPLGPRELGPSPFDHDDGESLFWRHERLHRRALRDPGRLFPLFAPERDRAEARFLAERPAPREAFAEGDRLLASWLERLPARIDDRRPAWARRYWRAREERASLGPAPAHGQAVSEAM